METLPEGVIYCRKCTRLLPEKDFHECSDGGFVDTNRKLSVCKNCIIILYDELFAKYQSMEKAIHKTCTSLNIAYSNEAVSATRAHIETLQASGKIVNAVFGIYKQKLLATQKAMAKDNSADMSYEDPGTIYVDRQIDIKELAIPKEVLEFWGTDISRKDVEFLETQYKNFKQTHKADTYAEIVLLKQVCYTMLDIKTQRANGDDTIKAVKELQDLMKNLAISPGITNMASANKGTDCFGLWIQDIEKEEPAQWLKSDPRGDMYRDVGNVEEYFQKYIVRPIKNFILASKDFNVDDEGQDDDFDEIDEGNKET